MARIVPGLGCGDLSWVGRPTQLWLAAGEKGMLIRRTDTLERPNQRNAQRCDRTAVGHTAMDSWRGNNGDGRRWNVYRVISLHQQVECDKSHDSDMTAPTKDCRGTLKGCAPDFGIDRM